MFCSSKKTVFPIFFRNTCYGAVQYLLLEKFPSDFWCLQLKCAVMKRREKKLSSSIRAYVGTTWLDYRSRIRIPSRKFAGQQ